MSSPFPFPSYVSSPSAALLPTTHAPSPNPLLAQALLGHAALGSSSSTPYASSAAAAANAAGAGLWGSSLLSFTSSPSAALIPGVPGAASPLAAFAASTTTTGQTPFPPGLTPGAATTAGPGTGAGRAQAVEVSIQEVVRSIDQAKMVLDQLEALLLRRQELEARVFGQPSNAGQRTDAEGTEEREREGMQVDGEHAPGPGTANDAGGMSAAQAQGALLQTQGEYVQLLSALSQLSTISLFGGLPLPLGAAGSNPPDPTKGVSMTNLTTWAEGRAGLEFSRREAIKAGAKAVLEVLKTGKQ